MNRCFSRKWVCKVKAPSLQRIAQAFAFSGLAIAACAVWTVIRTEFFWPTTNWLLLGGGSLCFSALYLNLYAKRFADRSGKDLRLQRGGLMNFLAPICALALGLSGILLCCAMIARALIWMPVLEFCTFWCAGIGFFIATAAYPAADWILSRQLRKKAAQDKALISLDL